MPKSPDSYALTRWNALKWATHCEGVMPCVGPDKCYHGYCARSRYPSPVGEPCPWESMYAEKIEREFREQWEMLKITPDVLDFDGLATEHVNIALQRLRTMARLNRSTTLYERRDQWGEAEKEAKLADLYLDRLSHRQLVLEAKLQIGVEIMEARAERLRPCMGVIEYLTVARGRAREEAEAPHEPFWDEFVDAYNAADPCLITAASNDTTGR